MEVILAKKHQIPIIRKIAFATWPNAFESVISNEQIEYMLGLMYSSEELAKRMAHKNRDFYLCKQEDEFVGFLVLEKDYNEKKQFKIEKVYVLPEKQGLGIGKFLFAFTEKRMREEGYSKLILDVNRGNTTAVEFYKKQGFSIVNSMNTDIGNGFLMEDYLMEKELI